MSTTTIRGSIISDIKRCYVDARIEVPCPTCKQVLANSMTTKYISYPEVDRMHTLWFYCSCCKQGYTIEAKVKNIEITLEYDTTTLSKD